MSHAATVSSLWAMDVYDYTATRGRDGPAKFLEGYQGDLQPTACSVYNAFFTPERGLIELGCWMRAGISSRRWSRINTT